MKDIQKATLGGGCFWCVEAIIQRLKGVEKVISGYTGGTTKDPTYREVSNLLSQYIPKNCSRRSHCNN